MLYKVLFHEGEHGPCTHHHENESKASDRTKAMLSYMINHNTQHALEIRQLESNVSTEAAALMEQAISSIEKSCGFLREALGVVEKTE